MLPFNSFLSFFQIGRSVLQAIVVTVGSVGQLASTNSYVTAIAPDTAGSDATRGFRPLSARRPSVATAALVTW